jgi:glycosyltransferase involved in cell wall biosynthesis
MSSPAQPLVSFVMPVWNPRRDWLEQAVTSVLRQRDCRLELLVVDDGCPEPVAPLLSRMDDDRLRVLRIDHAGVCVARNAGLAEVRGDRIRFVDADDVLEERSTARLLHLIGDDEAIIAYGATLFCDHALRPRWKMVCDLQGDAVTECLLGRFTVRPFSLLFPRSIVDKTGAWEPSFRVSDDWDYVLRSLEYARVRGDKTVATFYRKHPFAATTDLVAGERGARLVVERYFERHPEQRGTRLERQAYARLHAMLARARLTRGDLRGSLAEARRSAGIDPTALVEEARLSLPAAAGRVRTFGRPRREPPVIPTGGSEPYCHCR